MIELLAEQNRVDWRRPRSYTHKPSNPVTAWLVTEANTALIAQWCGGRATTIPAYDSGLDGHVVHHPEQHAVVVHNAIPHPFMLATAGDYVVAHLHADGETRYSIQQAHIFDSHYQEVQ